MPALTPLATPVAEPMVAMLPLVLLHVPPVVVIASVAELPIHTPVGPVIVPGDEPTVTVVVVRQPVGNV